MVKHDYFGPVFLTEGMGAGTTVFDVDQPAKASWKPLETIDIYKLYAQQFPAFNSVTKLVIDALNIAGHIPQVYIVGSPATDGKGQPTKNAEAIKNPASFYGLIKDVGEAIAEGHPPNGFTLFVTGPRVNDIQDLVDYAYDQWKRTWDGKSHGKVNPEVHDAVVNFAKTKVKPNHIVAWVELGLQTVDDARPSKERRVRFSLTRHRSKVSGHAGGYANETPTPAMLEKLRMADSTVASPNGLRDLRPAIVHAIISDTWTSFKTWYLKADTGFVHEFDREWKKDSVRKGYDDAKGHVPVTRFNPDLKNLKSVRGTPADRVVGSVADTGSSIGTMVVTANENERLHQDAQGNWVKPPDMPRQVGTMIPAGKVASWLEDANYKAIFGIYYDHPLIVPVRNKQIYWYSNKNHFMRAVHQYAVMTGDSPSLAYRVFNKSGPRSGIAITRVELERSEGGDAQRFLSGLDAVIETFHRQVKDGKALYEHKVAHWMGPDVKIPQNAYMDMPKAPEGLDTEKFDTYVRWVRKETAGTLGLGFQRNWPKKFMDPKTGKLARITHSRHQIRSFSNLSKTHKFTGERNAAGKVIEPSGTYLIEYLLGHKASGMLGETYMVTLNVIRADDDFPPQSTPLNISRNNLVKAMTEHFGKFPIARNPNNWTYIRPTMSDPFPFPRMIRHSVVLGKDLPHINKGLPKGIERTMFGYVIDGIEWDAYQMIVAMPPSVAEKEFGLLHRQAYRRLIIDEPRMVGQLRRGKLGKRRSIRAFGLTPFRVKFEQVPDAEGDEDMFARVNPGEIDPNKFGPDYSVLGADYWLSEIGDTWKPKIASRLNHATNVMERAVVDYERAKTFEEKQIIFLKYLNEVRLTSKECEHDIRSLMIQIASASQKQKMGNTSYSRDISSHVNTYIKYIRQEIEGGHTVMVPAVIKTLGLSVYEAPFGSIGLKTIEWSVKAPSASVAQLLILYRLLRRSVSNKDLGKAMGIKGKFGRYRVFPDNNARVLAHWARTNYLTIEQNDPRGIHRIASRIKLDKDELRRGEIDALQRGAKMLRID